MIPPLRLPVSEFRAPSPAVVFFTELVSRTDPAYQQNAPVARGTLYSTMVGVNQTVAAAYPSLYFVAERKFQQSDTLVFWDWATVPDAENTYNSEVKYVANAVAYPSFTRVYTLRRDDYEANTTLEIGSTLTALIGVRITDGGQAYTSATGTIEDKDVAINFVVVDGVIVSGVITSEGTGVLATDTIVVTGDGIGAVVTPIVQPTTCYLTSQVKQEMIQANPFRDESQDNLRNEFVRVIRIYETLPGPFITTTRIDDDGKVVTVNTRRNISANIVSQETLVAGVWTHTTKKGDDNFVGEESVETRDIPGNVIESSRFRSDGSTVLITKRLQRLADISPGGLVTGGALTLTKVVEVSDLVSYEVKEISLVPGPTIHGEHIDEKYGLVIDIEKTIVPEGTEGGLIAGAYVDIRTQDKWQSIQIASRLDTGSLPEDVQWFGTMRHSFPPELTDAIIDWAFAECGCSFSFSAVLIANLNQYSGMVKTRITEQFHDGPPPDDQAITQFFPKTHHFGFAWASACGSTDGNCRTKSGAPEFHIPLCLHDDLSLSVGANVWTFAATSPAALPHSTYIMLAPHVERWRFGVFRRVLTEVLVP